MNSQEIEEWVKQNDRVKSSILSMCAIIDNMIGSYLSERFTFTDDDKKNFHKIFFETSFVTFDTRIRMFETFLTIYENAWFQNVQIKQIFGLLKKFKKIRNDFAHAMDPLMLELQNTDKNQMPYCKIYIYENSEMVERIITKRQDNAIRRDYQNLKSLLAVVIGKITNHKNRLRSDIASGNI